MPLGVIGQIGSRQLGTVSVKLLMSLNACVRVIYFPPTAKVMRRRSQLIVSSERLDFKSSSLITRPRRLLSLNISCSQVSCSGSFSLLYKRAFEPDLIRLHDPPMLGPPAGDIVMLDDPYPEDYETESERSGK